METVSHFKFVKKNKNHFSFSPCCGLIVVWTLLDVVRQSRMSNGVLIQLNLVVVFVMVQNAYAVIYKVIAWQLDSLLPRSVKVQTTRINDTGLGA